MFMVDVSLLYIVLEDLLVYMLEVQLTCRQSKQMPIILFYMVLVIFCCTWPEVAMVQIISTKTRHIYSKAFLLFNALRDLEGGVWEVYLKWKGHFLEHLCQ